MTTWGHERRRWRADGRSDYDQFWPGLQLFSISTMWRLAETRIPETRGFTHAVSLHNTVPQLHSTLAIIQKNDYYLPLTQQSFQESGSPLVEQVVITRRMAVKASSRINQWH